MFDYVKREFALAIQAKSGASVGGLVAIAICLVAVLGAIVFLCISAYDWLSRRYDSLTAGLIMAGAFAGIAIIAAVVGAVIRSRTRQRAIFERAQRQNEPPAWLLDPKVLGTAMDIGRSIGWSRIVPIAVLGFLAAQWARERRDRPKS